MILVGPNAAGKSNILDCLRFLSELTRVEVRTAFTNRGSYTDVVWGGDQDIPIQLEIEGGFNIGGFLEPAEYGIIIEQDASQYIGVQQEWATRGKPTQFYLFTRKKHEVEYPSGPGSCPVAEALMRHIYRERTEAFAVKEAMASWSVYDFQRPLFARPQPVKKETRLAPDGSNAATVLHWVRNEDVATFDRLESLLKAAIPEVEHLLTPPDEQGQVYIAFKERHLPGRVPAWSLSEGSARLVATLLALFVPTPPALVAIEAPEISLHPYLMEYLADILRLRSRETQILITTHSPYLLNHLPPESLLIVTKERGETRVKRPRRGKALQEALKVLGLGDMWLAGDLGGVP